MARSVVVRGLTLELPVKFNFPTCLVCGVELYGNTSFRRRFDSVIRELYEQAIASGRKPLEAQAEQEK